jgi:hypothetical protein
MDTLENQILNAIPENGEWITILSIADRVKRSPSWVGYLLRKEIRPLHPEIECLPGTGHGYRYKPPDPP